MLRLFVQDFYQKIVIYSSPFPLSLSILTYFLSLSLSLSHLFWEHDKLICFPMRVQQHIFTRRPSTKLLFSQSCFCGRNFLTLNQYCRKFFLEFLKPLACIVSAPWGTMLNRLPNSGRKKVSAKFKKNAKPNEVLYILRMQY